MSKANQKARAGKNAAVAKDMHKQAEQLLAASESFKSLDIVLYHALQIAGLRMQLIANRVGLVDSLKKTKSDDGAVQ